MATEVGAARAAVDAEEQRCVGQTFCSTRFYLLIVTGDISSDHQLNKVKEQIKQGLRSWEIDLTVCNLDYELQLFKDKHSAQFSSEVKDATCQAI